MIEQDRFPRNTHHKSHIRLPWFAQMCIRDRPSSASPEVKFLNEKISFTCVPSFSRSLFASFDPFSIPDLSIFCLLYTSDVYKRQDAGSPCAAIPDGGEAPLRHPVTPARSCPGYTPVFGPVSYTHLDVYKRQLRSNAPAAPPRLPPQFSPRRSAPAAKAMAARLSLIHI